MNVDVTVVEEEVTRVVTPLLAVNVFEDVAKPAGATGDVDAALGGMIADLIADGEITGKLNKVVVIHTGARIAAKRVAVVGLGKQAEFTLDRVRQVSGSVAKRAAEMKITHFATIAHGAGAGNIGPRECAQATVEGVVLGTYEYRFLKTDTEGLPPLMEIMTIVERDKGKVNALREGVAVGLVSSAGTIRARDLSNGPGNIVTPTYLAERAREIADRCGLGLEVLGPQELSQRGFGTLLAVAEGSIEEPRLVVMRYSGRVGGKTLAVVGKGITFDSGGISIKPSERMWEMKHDMSGAATAIAFVEAAAQLRLPINVLAVIPATENMPSGKATKPGDVVKSYSGKTVEIQNTDAEGRLVLADALAYAVQQKPSAIVDLATLTGACVIALGHHASGAFGNDESLLKALEEAGKASGERIWPLPLWEEYAEELKSDVADLKNIGGGRYAGAIIGASFLRKFVDEIPWVHLDIAGTAWTDNAGPYTPKGATGVGVRLLLAFAQTWQDS